MNGTYVSIFSLNFESALKICGTFNDYTVLNQRKRFFREGEIDLELKEGYYRITSIGEYVYIEELNVVINDAGKEEWIVEKKVRIMRDSFEYMIVR